MPSAASPLPCFGAAYIRVSTDDQAELSPETQLEEIRKYAQREGIILLQEQIYIDSGISGKKAERRPEFMRMIATAKEKDCPFSTVATVPSLSFCFGSTPVLPETRRRVSSTSPFSAPSAASMWSASPSR